MTDPDVPPKTRRVSLPDARSALLDLTPKVVDLLRSLPVHKRTRLGQ